MTNLKCLSGFKKGVEQRKHWHVHSNPNSSENLPENALETYILLYTLKLMGVVSCFLIHLIITGTQRFSLIS